MTKGAARMSIPSSPRPSRARGAAASGSQVGGVLRRVLLVEHDEGCRAFAESALRGAGYDVDLACDGFEAIARLVDHRYDLVVCDVELPQLCGIDVVHELRSIERREGKSRARTPVIAFTSDGRAETYARALDADIDALLEKPLRSHELLESARDVADDRMVVLVIDADAERTKSIEKWCASFSKVRALFADCAADACLRLRRERIDLVAVHVSTEGLNGHVAARLLRVVAPPTLPVVALLEGADEAARARCIANGYVDCIGAPLDKAVIVSLLQTYRRGPSGRPPSRRLVSRPWSGAVIAAESDDDDVRALLPQFLNNLARDIDVLRKDLGQGLLESSVRVGHNCKGTGTSYGFPGISSIGVRLEEAGYRGDLTGALACIDALQFELEQGLARLT